MGVRYTNRAITTEQQIDILKERGLLIDDVERAVKALDIISYFRLAGYWRHFEADHTTHQFREGCRFADIIDLYSFDKQLRALLFTAIQTIAVLRNCCAHHSRLSNRVFPVKPKIPERMPNTWIADFSFREQTLYPQLCCVVYWLNSIVLENTFITDFKQLLISHPSVKTRLLGFPRNWEQEPLWR